MKTNNKGFSLVELIVVIAIMAILAAVAIPTFATFIGKAQRSSDESFLNDIEYAIELARAEDGGIPDGYTLEIQIEGGLVKTMTLAHPTDSKKNITVAQADLNGAIDFTHEVKLDNDTYTPDTENAGKWIGANED